MAAYASLLSLGHILDQLIQHPPRQRAVLDRAQIDYLLENITFLQDFLEEFSLVRGDEIQALEEKISRSAYAAEDIIEKRVVDQILENSEEERSREIFSHFNHFLKKISRSSSLFSRDLQKVIEEFGSMKKDVMKIKETERVTIVQQPRKDATAGSFIRGASDGKNTVVGFREDLNQILETLTGDESNLQILSIVGMGGIGKTTLARNVFDNPLTVHHFDLHAWVTISQQYSKHEILSGLLEEIGKEITEEKDHELGLRLHKILSDRRYFIVMDDVWSAEVWDGIKRFFPDNNNGSRVMVTTRISNVADSFQSCTPHRLHFLNEVNSWALFCHKVFGKESCPRELEEVGRTIVRNCSGLPLAIVTISGLLAKSGRTVEHWEYVANDTYAALNMGGDELCFEILSLSYKHLPVHLKPCFLYMAVFPEDSKIRISRLVKLWVAEGMLKPRSYRSVEEIAEDNLKDLIDRNLIQVHDYGSRNKMKTCTIHDLLRDVCLTEARKEKFLRVSITNDLNNHSRIINTRRRLIIRRSSDKEELKSTDAKLHRLQKILKMGYICSDEEIVRLVNSRYIDYNAGIFSDLLNTLESLSLLWNLQTVTIAGTLRGRTAISLPAEIWEMPQLRHLNWKEGVFNLPDLPSTNSENGRGDVFVLKNLQTLCNIRSFRCTDEVTRRIPNLKKLGIAYSDFPGFFESDFYDVHNLAHLHNLESLFLKGDENVWQNLCFPHSLKRLTLNHCGLCWEDMTVVGSLPHLEVLNLMSGAVIGREWNTVEGQFLELKSLRINHSSLEEWIADSSHFPVLEKLKLSWLSHLKEIPYGIGEIQTLQSISLVGCSDSAISSARNIQEEQQDLGNYHLQLHVVDAARKKIHTKILYIEFPSFFLKFPSLTFFS